MGTAAKPTRDNRTITVDLRDEATSFHLLSDGKAFLECVFAFLLALGFQLKHKATCDGGGCVTQHSHYARVKRGSLTIWRIQCTTCKAVRSISSRLWNVEGGVHEHEKALKRLASLQAMSPATERRHAVPPPDFTRYKV